MVQALDSSMYRTFEQIINSMSDIEFDRLVDSVKNLREVSIPVNEYFDQVEHLTEQIETNYKYNIKTHLDNISNLDSVLAA